MEPYLLPYQKRWVRDTSPLKIIEKSRQIGISFATAYSAVKRVGPAGARLDVWVSSRDETQARLFLEDCEYWATEWHLGAQPHGEKVFDADKGFAGYVLRFENGRSIYSLSSNPNALAGKRGHVILDEFALHADQRLLYRVAKPVTTWGGQLEIISTHRGANSIFNQILRDIKERGNPMGWSHHKVTLHDAVADGLVERINAKRGSLTPPFREVRAAAGGSFPLPLGGEGQGEGAVWGEGGLSASETRAQFLARLQRECLDEEQWRQEYCCQPCDTSTTFLGFDLITKSETDDCLKDFAYLEQCPNPLFLGLDIGRKRDLTIIDVGEKIGDVVWDRLRIELDNKTFAEQEHELYRLLRLPKLHRACIDASGIGMQLAERAYQNWGWKVERITFTAELKEQLAYQLRGDFQDGLLRICRDERLRDDLNSITKEVTDSGNIRFAGETADSHCDRFWAKALRQQAARYRTDCVGALVA